MVEMEVKTERGLSSIEGFRAVRVFVCSVVIFLVGRCVIFTSCDDAFPFFSYSVRTVISKLGRERYFLKDNGKGVGLVIVRVGSLKNVSAMC